MSQPIDLDEITNTAAVNGLQFPYYDYGEGPAVLLIHGFPDSKYLWRHQIAPIADSGFRVIAPDLRGYGDAPKPERVEDYALPLVLQDLIGLLDVLDIDRAHIVGHDWGGTVAWLLAGNHPDRSITVTGMTVGAPGAPGRRALPQLEKFWYIFFFQNEGVAEEWLSRDNWQGLREWSREAGDIDRQIAELSKPGALTAGLNWYRANFPPSALIRTSNPPRIKVPALGIAAENDAFLLEEHVKNSDAMIDGPWEYHLIEDASHWLMLDHAEEISTLLIDFFEKYGN